MPLITTNALTKRYGASITALDALTLEVEPGDLLYVPPRETHVVVNLSDDEPADYVVARDSPTEDSVEVPWAEG